MTKVQFYHNAPDQLALACELVAKAQAGGRQVAVRAADPAMARKLDLMLWTVEPLAFVPHVMNGSALAGETPVQIGAPGSDSGWPHADILFNLAADLAPGYDGFRTVVEIVGRSEAEKGPARARWTQYKTRGLPLKAFDAERRVAL